jgi:hypothetical protein
MATGAYERLRAWAETNGESLAVTKGKNSDGIYWVIETSILEPVSFSTTGTGKNIDAAATEVISDLTTVGVSIP